MSGAEAGERPVHLAKSTYSKRCTKCWYVSASSGPVRSVPAVSQHQGTEGSNRGRAVACKSWRASFKTHSDGTSTLMDLAVSVEFSNGSFSSSLNSKGQTPKVAASCAAFHLPQDTIEQAILKLARSSSLASYRLTLILPPRPQARNQAEIQYQIKMASFSVLTGILHIRFCVAMIVSWLPTNCVPLPQSRCSWEWAAPSVSLSPAPVFASL